MADTGRTQAVRGGLVVAAAMGVMNVAAYAYTIVAARVLGPAEYGAFAAMMGLVIVVNVVSLGLQATAARRVAADPSHRPAVEAEITVTARRAALLLALACLVLSPGMALGLHLDSWLTAAALAVPAAAYAVMGGDVGLLQGEGRWWAFATVFLSLGLARFGLGVAAILAWPHPLGAMAGVAAGALVPTVVARLAVRRSRAGSEVPGVEVPEVTVPEVTVPGVEVPGVEVPGSVSPGTGDGPADPGVLREAVTSSHALLAFFALTSIDVLLARAVLPEHEAGLYAAGIIATKAVLFLPYFLTVVAFPAMARRGAHRHLHLWGLAGVLAMGGVVVVGVALLPNVAVEFVGGGEYAALSGRLWAFAGLGTVLAGIQLLVYSALARRHPGAVWYLWGALAVIAAGLLVVTTATGLLALVLAVDTTLLVVLTLATRRDVVERLD